MFSVICWFVTMIVAGFAAFDTVSSLSKATGAPQQAAIAAVGVAIVVIPYVFSRAVQEIRIALLPSEAKSKASEE